MTKNSNRAPSGLGQKGRRFWKKVVSEYELENHHLELLFQASRCLDDISDAETAVEAHGSRYFKDRYGQLKEHPACSDIKQLRGLFQRLIREIGLDVNTANTRPPRYGG
jgi:phage terminase small subunit